MSLEASSLSIKVESSGIGQATEALNKLAVAGDKAERSTNRLAKSGAGAEAAAKAQAKVWYDLLDKVSRAHEREYNALQRHNNRLYGLVQAEANKMNKAYDASHKAFEREVEQHYNKIAQAEKRGQDRLARQAEQYYKQRDREAAKALQAETRRLAQMEAAAKASAERQRVLNSAYSTSSLAQQIATLQRAQAYGAAGGNVTSRFGSSVSSAMSSGELTRLQQQYRQLGEEAKRTNSLMSDTHAAVRGLSGSLGALWLTYGNLLPLMAGAAIGAGLKEAVTGFANVEYQMTFVKSLTEDTTNSVKQLSAAMHDVALSLGIAPEEAAKGLRALAQAGLNTKQAMESLAMVYKVSTVGELPLDTAALALTGVANAYGLVARDLEHVGDVMVKAGAMSATSVSAMSESMKYAAGTAEQYGVSLEKLGTVLTLLGKRTITGSSAGVAANNLIAEIYSPSSEKAIKAQAKLGVKAYVDGVRQELNVAVGSIREGLARFDAESQGKLLEDMFGKKGGRGFYAVAMADQKEFLKIEEELRESTGFTAKVFADSQQTIRGQMDLTKAAITNTFAVIGEETAAPLKELLRGVRAAFNSDELKDALVGFSQSMSTMLKVVVPLAVAYGGLWAAMKVGTLVVPMLARAMAMLNFTAIATGVMAATSAALKFGQALAAGNIALAAANPIGIAILGTITLLAGAYLLFKRNKESALELHDKEMANSQETLDMLDKENKLLEKKLELQRRGVSESGMDAALRKMEGEDAAGQIRTEIEANNARIKALSNQGVQRSDGAESARQTAIDRLTNANKDLTKALAERLSLNQKLEASEKRRAEMTAQYMEQERINRDSAQYAAEGQGTGPGGTERYGDKPDRGLAKIQNATEAEYKELTKLAAGYDAKTASLLEFYRTGEKVATESRQAIVESNRINGMYGSTEKTNALYLRNLAQAKLTDEAKFREEKAKSFVELTGNMQQIIDGEDAFQKAARESGTVKAGTYERQIEAAGKALQMSDAELAKAREMAKAADEINRVLAARQKLETATASTTLRADAALEEAEAMAVYGERTKISAMQVAELTIAKAKLTDAGSEATVNALREAAATEQLNVAYRDLMKQQISMYKDLEDAEAASLMTFVDSEMERVRIAEQSRKAIAAATLATAQEAFDKKAMDGTATFEDVATINAANKAYEETLGIIGKISKIDLENLTLKKEINRWKELGETIENSLSKAFGKAGDAAGKMFNLFAQGQAREMLSAKQISALKEAQEKDGIDRTQEINDIQQHNAQMRISEYAGMADAAKGFFDEGSRGYEAMTKASKVLHAAEVALSLIKGVNAILTQGSGDPYSAFARMAAMAAMVAALGVAVSGGGGAPMSSKDKQSIQGTGSVLGSQTVTKGNKVELVGAKSESISNSLSILEKNSGLGLVQQNGMLNAMRNLANNIEKLAVNVVRDSDLSGAGIATTRGGAANFGSSTAGVALTGGFIGLALDKLTGGWVGKITGSIMNKIFGGKTTNEDTGFTIGKTSLGDIIENGTKAFQYFDMKKEGGLFRSDKYWTDNKTVGDDANAQFTKVFQSMANTLFEAGKVFGIAGDEFNGKIRTLIVDIGEISLKGLSGEEIAKELQAVFSKVGDGMAKTVFPEFLQYQKIGEGMLETVARVANEFLQVSDVFTVLGRSLPKAIESVAVTQQIIEAFGSIDNLTAGVSEYMQSILSESDRLAITTKSVAEGMAALNLGAITTKAQFKALVDSLDLTKTADIALFQSLMQLAPLFGQVADAADAAAKSAEEAAKAEKERLEGVLSQRLELEGRIAELTENTVEAARVLAAQRAIELSKMDESLRPLQERVWVLEDESAAADKAAEKAKEAADKLKEVYDALVGLADTAFGRLSKSVEAEKENINKSYDAAIDAARKAADAAKESANMQLEAAQKQRDAISNVLSMLDNALSSTEVDSPALTKARRAEAQAYLQTASIQAKSGGSVANLGGLENALAMIAKPSEELFATFEDYARDQAAAENAIANLRNTAQTQLSAAELTIKGINDTIDAIEKSATDTIAKLEEQRQQELENMDKILENAQAQLDALRGIDNSILTLSQAMTQFASTVAAAKVYANSYMGGSTGTTPAPGSAESTASTAQQLADIYQNNLGRAPDDSGFKFYLDNILAGKTTLADVNNSMKTSAEYLALQAIKNAPKLAVGTDYVPRDMMAMLHEGEAVVPAADNAAIKKALADKSESTEVQGLRQEISDLKQIMISNGVATVQAIKEGTKVLKKFDQEGMPEQREVELQQQ